MLKHAVIAGASGLWLSGLIGQIGSVTSTLIYLGLSGLMVAVSLLSPWRSPGA